ncbi:DUF262 domain-containing protein [Thiocystis violacea]|uniref:DUF262 domain-containing protein n=1 Tax=Thiocystis violacea TaxID=13725 RepID=UPI001907E066|nr:DUF262 domain-containing protein [Thiocystis violacea]MBK1719710.1 hypothetical protein [Thiocystis violacea]
MTTSFRNLFREGGIDHIEIPRMQRDYAQGRQDGDVPRIRRKFLEVLCRAVTKGESVGLDFIYGEVEDRRIDGTVKKCMIPLDGQQRLTTLFLLHWYLAARSRITGSKCDFLGRFTYETRYSARDFCKKLVLQRPDFPHNTRLSEWLGDQHWYAWIWKHDPTIQSMLVMLDDIHDLLKDADDEACQTAWDRLVSENAPAISFESLSLEKMGLTDDLYIKMNSRGKPLTPFERFKADFEQTLKEISEANEGKIAGEESSYQEFIRKVDQEWSDLLWRMRGDDDIIDDEFLRLFRFISDIFVYRYHLKPDNDSALFGKDIDGWAEGIYGKDAHKPLDAHRHLFDAFDSLYDVFVKNKEAETIADWFRSLFTENGYKLGAVAIFDSQVDLLGNCCAKYGKQEGNRRAFTLSHALLLFAVLEYLMAYDIKREDFTQRLRTLRNLIFASDNEIRLENFPALLNETAEFIRTGDLGKVAVYNSRQIAEERDKAGFLNRYSAHAGLPEILHRLEDHDLLRGCLAAFDLSVDDVTFSRRTEIFREIFIESEKAPYLEIGAALLACGDYSQKTSQGRYRFVSPENAGVWRSLLTNPGRKDIDTTRKILENLLDTLANTPGASMQVRLNSIASDYLAKQETAKQFDWRYYLVKYGCMRSGNSGLYISSSGAMGFDLCMMEKTQLNSYYRDPYLSAVIQESGAKEGQDQGVEAPYFYGWDGYTPSGRWIKLARTGERILSCRDDGFQLQEPSQACEQDIFAKIIKSYNVCDDLVLRVPQVVNSDITYDQEDRVLVGAKLLKELIICQQSIPLTNSASGGSFVEGIVPA